MIVVRSIYIAIFALLTACSQQSDLSSFTSLTNPDIPVAVTSNATGQVELYLSPKDSTHDKVLFCAGDATTCSSASNSWSEVSPLTIEKKLYKVSQTFESTQLKTTTFYVIMYSASQVAARRTFKFADKTTPDNPENPSNPEQANCIDADEFTCQVELAIHKYTNEYRQQAGRSQLAFHSGIAYASRDWSKKQYQQRSIGHAGFPSQRRQVYHQKFGKSVSMSRENVAMSGGVGRRDADAIGKYFANMWFNSPGHKANMLASGIRTHGAGIHKSGGTVYATQIFGR